MCFKRTLLNLIQEMKDFESLTGIIVGLNVRKLLTVENNYCSNWNSYTRYILSRVTCNLYPITFTK